jgi:hypothetical protein
MLNGILVKNGGGISLLAPWAVAAAVTCNFRGLTGSAAAGISEFQGGRAFIPVAFAFFMVFVGLTACAGVFGAGCFCGYIWLVLVGFLCSSF